jgi:hypothetical protein
MARNPETVTLKFNRTDLSDTYGKKIGSILKFYINKRRGNAFVPQMQLTSEVDAVKPIKKFKNPDDFYTQFNGDGKNTIVMTVDDQFFRDASGDIIDPDVVSTTLLIGRAEVEGWTGDEYFGKLWIEETDVYLRSDFFSRSKLEYNINGAAAFSMALGYRPTVWSHDYLSKNGSHVNKSTFANAKSDVWTKISNERDNFYYLDDLTLTAPDYLDTPRLLPFENEVIDIGGYTLPSTDPGEPFPLAATPVLFLTNLKAYDGKYKLTLVVSRITGESPPAAKKLLKLSGNCIDYPMVADGGEEFYPTIHLTEVRLGRESDLAKLRKAVETYGTAQIIDGVQFPKAVKIQVDISGRLYKGGKTQSLTRSFWLVDSDQQWRH